MEKKDNKETFGFNIKKLQDFLNKNNKIPKGTFQIKKRGLSYYWYYTLSVNDTNRVKYLSKAYKKEGGQECSFTLALKNLRDKYYNKNVITLDPLVPNGELINKWISHKFNMKLVNPSNKRKYTVIVVGTGLAGASASASAGASAEVTDTSVSAEASEGHRGAPGADRQA